MFPVVLRFTSRAWKLTPLTILVSVIERLYQWEHVSLSSYLSLSAFSVFSPSFVLSSGDVHLMLS